MGKKKKNQQNPLLEKREIHLYKKKCSMKVTLLSQKSYLYVKQICYKDPALLNLHTPAWHKCYK